MKDYRRKKISLYNTKALAASWALSMWPSGNGFAAGRNLLAI